MGEKNKLIEKSCVVCEKLFLQYHTLQKTCSFVCTKIRKSQLNKIYKAKQKEKYWYTPTTIYKKVCDLCWKDYETTYKHQKKCSRKCFSEEQKVTRKWKNNPAYRNWKFVDWDKWENRKEFNHKNREFQRNAKKILQRQLDTVWYSYCEHCNSSQSWRWETHHIVYRSEKPKHEYLHDERNLIRLCITCHNEFHKHKASRKELVEKRKLVELFGPLSNT